MSEMRQREREPMVRGYAVTHPAGEVQLPTQPGWDQVLYAVSGLFVARTPTETWTVPPHRALCVPDGTNVAASTSRPTALRCLYFRHELKALRFDGRVVSTSPLTRHLLLDVVDRCPLWVDDDSEKALVRVVIDQLAASPTAPLHLPHPTDSRCRELAVALEADPTLTLDQAMSSLPVSRRTLERRFNAETGMTLAGWHRRSRILSSLELLGEDRPMTEVALASGYATSSSFVAAFRSELGMTPRRLVG